MLPAGRESAVQVLLPRPAVLPERARPAAGPGAPERPVKAAWPRSAGHPRAAKPGQRGPLPGTRDSRAAPPPAATVQLQLLLLPVAAGSPGTAAAPGRAAAGTRDGDPRAPGLGSARDPLGPAAPRLSTARMVRATSSGSSAAGSAPPPAPSLRGVLSRGLRSACAGVPEPSRPQVPPPAPPFGAGLGLGGARASALGLQSFSSRRCSPNKRGAGPRTRRNS